MISKNRIAFLRALQQKKTRRELGLFTAEGTKTVLELLHSSLVAEQLIASRDWLTQHQDVIQKVHEIEETDPQTLERISSLSTAPDVFAVFRIPDYTFNTKDLHGRFTLAADGIRDPGNLGTLIRIADWFGIERILCSVDTVEVWNPKTVQATMGSLARVQIIEVDLPSLLSELKQSTNATLPIFGTFLEGTSIYETNFGEQGIIIIGSESHGIRDDVKNYVSSAVTIPSFSSGQGAESLNAGVAAGIICAEVRRQLL